MAQVQILRCSAVRNRYACPASCQGILVPSAPDSLLPLPPWLPQSLQVWQQYENKQGSSRWVSGCQKIGGAFPDHSVLLHMTSQIPSHDQAPSCCPCLPRWSPWPPHPQIPASLAQSTIQLRSRQGEEHVRLRPAARCCCQSNQPGDKPLLLNINHC